MYLLEQEADATQTQGGSSWHLLATHLTIRLQTSGTWDSWGEAEADISWPPSLAEAAHLWRVGESIEGHRAIAALCRRGSRRGGNDDDAALAVIVLLDPGICRAASRLADVCGLDDVRAAVWEAVKRAEPHLGPRAPRFILKRAQQRLVKSAAGFVKPHDERLSLDVLIDEELVPDLFVVESEPSDPRRELSELLEWASASGVLCVDEAEFLRQLVDVAAQVPDDQAANELSIRRGISARTVRRHRAAVLDRLRDALPAYLAATAS